MNSRSIITVNNHLGYLHNLFRQAIPLSKSDVKGFNLNKNKVNNNTILYGSNIISTDLAEKVRDFLQKIPIDKTIKEFDDVDILPKDNIYKSFLDVNNIRLAYENRICDPTKWMWERYFPSFWRACPLTSEAFLGSPIIELFDVMEEKFYATQFDDCDITKYRKATLVIQMMEQNCDIPLHDDFSSGRRLCFTHYLTPNDWNKKDGGELCVIYKNEYCENMCIFEPVFNSMVMWQMKDSRSPIHGVNKVCTDKKRISLVGFFNE